MDLKFLGVIPHFSQNVFHLFSVTAFLVAFSEAVSPNTESTCLSHGPQGQQDTSSKVYLINAFTWFNNSPSSKTP